MGIKKIGIKAVRMLRVGQGYDLHPLVLNRPLILGGVTVFHPDNLGLAGVTDGDCLTHAIIDAILGAAGLGYCCNGTKCRFDSLIGDSFTKSVVAWLYYSQY